MHLVWHRTELRTHDHPGLAAAAAAGGPVVPLVIVDPIIFDRPSTTPRRQAWFLENVRALRESYRALGSDLIVREGVPHEVLGQIAREHSVEQAHFIRNHTPYARERDAAATAALQAAGVAVHAYPGQYSHPPGEILTGAGKPYSVFGPYARTWRSLPLPDLAPTPERIPAVPRAIARGTIPRVEPGIPLPATGEAAARERLETFLREAEATYATAHTSRPAGRALRS